MSFDKMVFIVGVSRSGTTLMRRVLNKSTKFALLDENNYMGHLWPPLAMRKVFSRFGSLNIDQNVVKLVDWFYSSDFDNYSRLKTVSWQWQWFRDEVPKEQLLERILSSDRSEKGIYLVFMELFCEEREGEVIGEKTPSHIKYIDTIMQWYPDAKIIHMLRDPRAIYTSEVRRRQEKSPSPPYRQLRKFPLLLKLFLMFQVTWTWGDALKRYRKYSEKYGSNYRVVQFESMIGSPESEVRSICDWVGVEFQEIMLEQQVMSEGFTQGKKGFDTTASRRWEKHIDSWARSWFESRFRKALLEVDYDI